MTMTRRTLLATLAGLLVAPHAVRTTARITQTRTHTYMDLPLASGDHIVGMQSTDIGLLVATAHGRVFRVEDAAGYRPVLYEWDGCYEQVRGCWAFRAWTDARGRTQFV